MHVLIIGGGLAGPCLALSLAKRAITSTIYEIHASRSNQGGSISLEPNGLRVLDKYAGVYSKLKEVGYSYTRLGAYFDNGEKLGEIEISDEAGYSAIRVLRSELHNVLLDACKAAGIEVKLGVKLEKITEGDGVKATFADGTVAKGDLLVGADGIHSKVRQHILGDVSPSPIFQHLCIVNGFVPASKVTCPPAFQWPAFTLTPAGFLMAIPIDNKAEMLAWGINMTVSEDRPRAAWRAWQDSGEAAKLAKADYDEITTEPVRSLLDNADLTQSRIWAAYAIPDIPTWHSSRTVLIGDAAHALPPNGQGSGVAFEDAAILTRLLDETQLSIPDILARFEALRRPRSTKIRAKTDKASAVKYRAGPWVWAVKKMALKSVMWFKSGVLSRKEETEYDVDAVDLGAK